MTESANPTFFIDRALGQKLVAEALRRADASVEVHADHFAADAPDTEKHWSRRQILACPKIHN